MLKQWYWAMRFWQRKGRKRFKRQHQRAALQRIHLHRATLHRLPWDCKHVRLPNFVVVFILLFSHVLWFATSILRLLRYIILKHLVTILNRSVFKVFVWERAAGAPRMTHHNIFGLQSVLPRLLLQRHGALEYLTRSGANVRKRWWECLKSEGLFIYTSEGGGRNLAAGLLMETTSSSRFKTYSKIPYVHFTNGVAREFIGARRICYIVFWIPISHQPYGRQIV